MAPWLETRRSIWDERRAAHRTRPAQYWLILSTDTNPFICSQKRKTKNGIGSVKKRTNTARATTGPLRTWQRFRKRMWLSDTRCLDHPEWRRSPLDRQAKDYIRLLQKDMSTKKFAPRSVGQRLFLCSIGQRHLFGRRFTIICTKTHQGDHSKKTNLRQTCDPYLHHTMPSQG